MHKQRKLFYPRGKTKADRRNLRSKIRTNSSTKNDKQKNDLQKLRKSFSSSISMKEINKKRLNLMQKMYECEERARKEAEMEELDSDVEESFVAVGDRLILAKRR